MKRVDAVLATLAVGIAIATWTQATDNKSTGEASKMMPVPPSPVSPSATVTARGEVKNVDRDAGTITVRHGKLANLQMPATTTVFRVKDRAMLNQVKQGDRINFSVSNASGLVTALKVEVTQ